MTIAVGFLCGGGEHLILAADRQITVEGAYKIRREKYTTSKQGFVELACFYSGEPGTFSEFAQRVEDFLSAQPEVSTGIVQNAIENTLDTMRLRDPFLEPCFSLLAGISELFEAPKLLVFDGKSVFRAHDRVSIIGCGDTSLINYLSDQLHRPDLTANQGIALGAYLVKKATQYVDGCGEPIDVIHGDGVGFQVVEMDKVTAGIQAIENQEEFLFTWLVQTPFQL